MAWNPQIQVFDERAIKDNVFGYVRGAQTEALYWANGGAAGLPTIRDFHKSPRLTTIFPALTLLQTRHTSKYATSDVLEIQFSILFEMAIVHGNKDILSDRATKYSMALESMIANMPETTLNQNSIIGITSTRMDFETTFEVQGKYKTQYIEVFQTLAKWEFDASIES